MIRKIDRNKILQAFKKLAEDESKAAGGCKPDQRLNNRGKGFQKAFADYTYYLQRREEE
jgi:hypothetical protein